MSDNLEPSTRADWFERAGISLTSGDFEMAADLEIEIVNERQVSAALQRSYRRDLRARGVSGTALVGLKLRNTGEVEDIVMISGTGSAALDQSAIKVAEVMRFSAPVQSGCKVRAWIAMPIMFRVG